MEQKSSYYKKHRNIEYNEFSKKVYNGLDALKNHVFESYPVVYTDDPTDYSIANNYKNKSDFVWLVVKGITVSPLFSWWFRPPLDGNSTVFQFPCVYKKSRVVKSWNSVQLVSTSIDNVIISKQRVICNVYDAYQGKDKYDMFFLQEKNNIANWIKFSNKYPEAILVTSIEQALSASTTDMLWIIPDDVNILDTFKFDFEPDDWSFPLAHVFINGQADRYNGIVLLPKNYNISNRETMYRFYASRKIVDIPASTPELYEKFYINNYQDYLQAIESTTTSMFWGIPGDVTVDNDFEFDHYVPKWDELFTHVFLNGSDYTGVVLFPTSEIVPESNFADRSFVNKKLVPIVISEPAPTQYDKFYVNTYDEYLNAVSSASTLMFWVIPKNVTPYEDFKFDFYIPMWDKKIIHTFLNDFEYDGIVLFPSDSIVSEEEFNQYSFKQKQIIILASTPNLYEKFHIDNYEEYRDAIASSSTDMFWCIPNDVEIANGFKFDYHVPKWDEYYSHVFLNGDYYDGVSLLSKKHTISKNEFDNRFFINKKKINEIASIPANRPFDIVFISYHETSADANYRQLLKRFPRAKRIDNVSGIHNAHIAAAKCVTTDMFWVVDADAIIEENFNFDLKIPHHERDIVHVWRSRNPFNNLIYGYGGVKLLPTKLTLELSTSTLDMTTSISPKFKSMARVSNLTAFNTDPFNTWKSAFRECVKLSSGMIDRQNTQETTERLDAWINPTVCADFFLYAIQGALQGKEFGEINRSNKDQLLKINDFNWLKEQFDSMQSFPIQE